MPEGRTRQQISEQTVSQASKEKAGKATGPGEPLPLAEVCQHLSDWAFR
jgi:hypothetical protein